MHYAGGAEVTTAPSPGPGRRSSGASRPRAVRRRAAARRGRRPQPADRARDHVPRAVRLHRPDLADDERPGALAEPLAGARSTGSNYVDVFEQAPLWRYALNTIALRGLATLGLLVSSIPVAYALARLRWRGRNAAFVLVLVDDDAAAAGDDRAALRDVGEAPPGRHALAADPPELARRRVLDLPAAPVLPDDPGGVPRRRARRRLRRVPDPDYGRRAGWPSRRSPRSRCSSFLFYFNDFFGPLLYTGENADALDAVGRPGAVPDAAPGAVEPDDGGDAARSWRP